MYFAETFLSGKFTVAELKYCTAYHLCNEKKTSESQALLNANDTLEQKIAETMNIPVDKLNVNHAKKYFSDMYFHNSEDRIKYDVAIVSFILTSSKASILYGYLDTEFGHTFMEQMLRIEFGNRAIKSDKVSEVLQLFKTETIIRYSTGHKGYGRPDSYLKNAFNFFMASRRYQVANILDRGSATIGEEQRDLNQIKNDSILSVAEDYDIPNFKELVTNIYNGSVGLKYRYERYLMKDSKTGEICLTDKGKPKYKESPLGIIVYDIYSSLKSLMVVDRVTSMKNDPQYKKYLKSLKLISFEAVDVNKDCYFIIDTEYDYRNYTSRKSAVSEIRSNLKIDNNQELFRIYFHNDVEGGDNKNNTNVLGRKKETFNNDVITFRAIIKGIKSAVFLINFLVKHGIDPLSLPSEIFRDPAWLQRASNLKEYLILHKNVTDLEKDNFEIYDSGELICKDNDLGLRHNKMLTWLIQDELKARISEITPGNVKEALSVDGFNRTELTLSQLAPFTYLNQDVDEFTKSYNIYKDMYDELCEILVPIEEQFKRIKQFLYVLEYLNQDKENPLIVRIGHIKNPKEVAEVFEVVMAINSAYAIINRVDDNERLIFPMDEEDIQEIESGEAFDLSTLKYDWFVGDMSEYEFKYDRKYQEEYNAQIKDLAVATIKYYSFEERKEIADYYTSINEILNPESNVTVDLDTSDSYLSKFGLSVDYLNQHFDSTVEMLQYLRDVVGAYYNEMAKHPCFHNGEVRFLNEREISYYINNVRYIDWMPKYEHFDEYCNAVLDYANQTNNKYLRTFMSEMLIYVNSNKAENEDGYDALVRALRNLSVQVFIGDKLRTIMGVLAGSGLNDIDFVDTFNICKDFIDVLNNGCRYSELVKYDKTEFKRKLRRINKKCNFNGIFASYSLAEWERDQDEINHINTDREILTCLPKRSHQNSMLKMQKACDKAQELFREQINFFVWCSALVQEDEVDIGNVGKELLGEQYDRLMAHASYIKVYPEKIENYRSMRNMKDLSSPIYTLYKDEYILNRGEFETKIHGDHIYFLHKAGVYICPDFDIGDENCILSN